jgi:hypothetical protein
MKVLILLVSLRYPGCSQPENPTLSHLVPATMSTVSGSTAVPHSFGSTVHYSCPKGYRWAPAIDWQANSWKPYNESSPVRHVTVECLGTLGWTYYDVTRCFPSSIQGLPETYKPEFLLSQHSLNSIQLSASRCKLLWTKFDEHG